MRILRARLLLPPRAVHHHGPTLLVAPYSQSRTI